jgi:hypothetical protein
MFSASNRCHHRPATEVLAALLDGLKAVSSLSQSVSMPQLLEFFSLCLRVVPSLLDNNRLPYQLADNVVGFMSSVLKLQPESIHSLWSVCGNYLSDWHMKSIWEEDNDFRCYTVQHNISKSRQDVKLKVHSHNFTF